jgi:hypothetical protein
MRKFCNKISGRTTVPQIFFNKKHIGGSDDLHLLHEENKLKELVEETLKEENPTDFLPIIEEKEEKKEKPKLKNKEEEEELKKDKEIEDLIELMKDPKKGIEIKDRWWHLKLYKTCFVGSEFVSWLIKNKKVKDKEEAVEFGQYLMDIYVFKHVCSSEPFLDGEYFYRLQSDVKSKTLNEKKIFIGEPRKANEVAVEMRKVLTEIFKKFSSDGRKIDFDGIKDSDLFKKYIKIAEELQRVDLGSLKKNEKKAFFINIYNTLVIHGYIENGAPKSALQRVSFFNKTSYNIGNFDYSLNDIEHGILRGNKTPPGSFSRKINPKDPRALYIYQKMDPRIHFAVLNFFNF